MNPKILFFLLCLIACKISAQSSITLLEPANDAKNVRLHPVFKWTKGSNSGAYDFHISKKADMSNASNHGFTGDSLYMICSLLPSTQYYWRVRSWENGPKYGEWSSIFTFTTRDTVINLTTRLKWPLDKSQHDVRYPVNFKWTGNAGCQSVLELSKNPSMAYPVDFFHLTGLYSDSTYTHPGKLEANTTYYWRVCTIWPQGPWSPVFSFNTVDSGPGTQPTTPQPGPPQPPAPQPIHRQSQQAFSFPNPFAHVVTINFQLNVPGVAQFEISDSQGSKIDRFNRSFSEKGWQSVEWRAISAQPGNYFCKIVTGEKTEIVKLLLTR